MKLRLLLFGVKFMGHQGSNVLTTGQTTLNNFAWTGIRAVPNRPHTFGMALATSILPAVAQVAYLSGMMILMSYTTFCAFSGK